MRDDITSKLHFGLAIEARAEAWYLAEHPGARLLARNFRWRGGEIDLIFEEPVARVGTAGPGWELVFVEVRARLGVTRSRPWPSGVESVQGGKLRRLRNGVSVYLAGHYRGQARSARLDLMGWDGDRWEHLRNVD